MSEEIDHEYTNEIVCPWCGYEFSDSWEWSDYEEDVECHKCGKLFYYERILTVEYKTTRERCKNKGCEMALKKMYGNNPSVSDRHGNVTVWQCRICDHEIYKFSDFCGGTPRVELLTLGDFE